MIEDERMPERAGTHIDDQGPLVRPGGHDDATLIAALAIQVFLDTYAAEGVRGDLAREALRNYSSEAFAMRLRDPACRFLLAERPTGLIGFAEIRTAALDAPGGTATGAELVRLYVQPAGQRRGTGRRLIRAAEETALAAGLDTVWLTVWEGNHRARAFYAALGYRDVGATSYRFELETYSNLVLAKELPPDRTCM